MNLQFLQKKKLFMCIFTTIGINEPIAHSISLIPSGWMNFCLNPSTTVKLRGHYESLAIGPILVELTSTLTCKITLSNKASTTSSFYVIVLL